jgi:hypothetical protein
VTKNGYGQEYTNIREFQTVGGEHHNRKTPLRANSVPRGGKYQAR